MNLFDLPNDLLIQEIFQRVKINDIIHILLTNKKIYDTYYPKYREELVDYKKGLWHQKTIAGPQYVKNLRLFKRHVNRIFRLMNNAINKPDFEEVIFVDQQLVSVMNLDHFEKTENRTVYGLSALLNWWLIYVIDNRLVTISDCLKIETTTLTVTIDDLIGRLVTLPVGTLIFFYDFTILLLQRYTLIINIPVSINIIYNVCRENFELCQIASDYRCKL